MNNHHLTVGLLHVNCFLLIDPSTREAWLIDPGGNAGDILAMLASADARLTRILLTHAHFDHLLAAPDIKKATGAPLFMLRA
jgi:glyoxylase-like metal-dependent hydrolase (beta-lactamase superfamily II)